MSLPHSPAPRLRPADFWIRVWVSPHITRPNPSFKRIQLRWYKLPFSARFIDTSAPFIHITSKWQLQTAPNKRGLCPCAKARDAHGIITHIVKASGRGDKLGCIMGWWLVVVLKRPLFAHHSCTGGDGLPDYLTNRLRCND
jgi:hypothetical protein